MKQLSNISISLILVLITFYKINSQKLLPFKLPDTGQLTSFTHSGDEDSDLIVNPMSFTDNGDGTITDNNTGLVWQKTDSGEMSFENAVLYCENLEIGNYTDWRLPECHELFSINYYDAINPALKTTVFTKTSAEYWWTSEKRRDNSNSIWVVNAGGGIGAHPKTETVSAGGTKKFHVRAVRNPYSTSFGVVHFKDNADGSVTDNFTGLTWQKNQIQNTMNWEEALSYASTFSLAGKSGWRLPDIKELQSLNDEKLSSPSIDKTFFPGLATGRFWSSTSSINSSTKAWDLNTEFGIVSYSEKTSKNYVLLVRGGLDNSDLNLKEKLIPSGEYEMGDHYGFVDPSHPSDELPLHLVSVDSFYMGITEVTNQQFVSFLNSGYLDGSLEVKGNIVYLTGSSTIVCFTNEYEKYYSIGFDGKSFSIYDFRANHPVVGVMWYGAIAFCNWLSRQNDLEECYNPGNGNCDFSKNGYRLPTEAEWEWAGRGGQTTPYYNYPWGNDQDVKKANWPNSKDPFEGTSESDYPFTTPVGFYDGSEHLKSEFNWKNSVTSYKTSDGSNAFGLFDMAGNVWEFVNDWYGQNYYSISPKKNPAGPSSGFIMPDGKPYRGMRGGNWYNGYNVTGGNVNDGHSRVSNRNPSYYRGPQDPDHPWYHVGFRVARKYSNPTTFSHDTNINTTSEFSLLQNSPNPFSASTTISFNLSKTNNVILKIFDCYGQEIETLVDEKLKEGDYNISYRAKKNIAGLLYYKLIVGKRYQIRKMINYNF